MLVINSANEHIDSKDLPSQIIPSYGQIVPHKVTSFQRIAILFELKIFQKKPIGRLMTETSIASKYFFDSVPKWRSRKGP